MDHFWILHTADTKAVWGIAVCYSGRDGSHSFLQDNTLRKPAQVGAGLGSTGSTPEPLSFLIPSATGLFLPLSFLPFSCIPVLVFVFDAGNEKSKLSWCSRAGCKSLTWISRVWHSTLELRIQTRSVITSAFHIQLTFPVLHYLKVKLSVFFVCLNCLRRKMV